jgi:hypothetical protein
MITSREYPQQPLLSSDKPRVWPHRYAVIAAFLTLAILVASLLRFLYLGNTFQSSDNAELPAAIVVMPGYRWMPKQHYGLTIYLYVKLFAGLLSALGISIDEFWWKAPIALVGVLQVPLTFAFLKRLKHSNVIALYGAALVAVLPIHVM